MTERKNAWADIEPARWQALQTVHGTPFYLFDADVVKRRIEMVKDAAGGLAGVYYAVKANPNLGLLKFAREFVDGVDISSGGEQVQAALAGFSAGQMSFAGPAKTDAELEAAVAAGVGCISVESLREIDSCASIASRIGKQARILLRVNPSHVHRAYGLKMGGRAVQFGIDEEVLPEAEQRVLFHGAHLQCRGLHSYVGSQCFDATGTLEATKTALRLAEDFEGRTGLRCSKINLGGGFGVAQSGEHRELSLHDLGPELRSLLSAFQRSRQGCEIFFELGRFITAEAGIYVTRVIDVKTSRGLRYLVCDGGLNHQLAAAGTFGAALRSNFPVLNLSRPQGKKQTVNVAGPSCNPTDLLGIQVEVPEAEPGDLLGVAMSGSYGLTASPLLFLGRDTPPELVMTNGNVSVGRRRHSMTDFN